MSISFDDLKDLLDTMAERYNRASFVIDDPISVPHLFRKKEDIEIAAFLAASLAWGKRPVIIRNARKLMQWMDYSPLDFILNANRTELKCFHKFKHRTFNGEDCIYFIRALQEIYKKHDGLEMVFSQSWLEAEGNAGQAIHNFRKYFFSFRNPGRTAKHVADPLAGSSAKRINMFLRWMVRNDNRGVDFGIWTKIKPADLACPLDVHTGKVARKLGILNRKLNDWGSVTELTEFLITLDPFDPIRYDFALFGLGMYENF